MIGWRKVFVIPFLAKPPLLAVNDKEMANGWEENAIDPSHPLCSDIIRSLKMVSKDSSSMLSEPQQ